MRSILFTCLFLVVPQVVSATEHNHPSNLTVICNPNGAEVRVNDGAFRGSTYYLGKSCDAARKSGGTGKWWYAAAAFIVQIDGQGARFSNEIDCPSLPYCRP